MFSDDDVRELVEGMERRIRALENICGANGIVVTRSQDGVVVAGERRDVEPVADSLPFGDIEAQTLNWDNTKKVWYAGPARLM